MSKLKMLMFICLAIMVGNVVMAQHAVVRVSPKIFVYADNIMKAQSHSEYEEDAKLMIDDTVTAADKISHTFENTSHKFIATGNATFTDGFVTIKATNITTDTISTIFEFAGNISVTYTVPAVEDDKSSASKTFTVNVGDDCTLTYDYYTAIADVKKIEEVIYTSDTTETKPADKATIGDIIRWIPW